MGKIKKLSTELINLIAAGEVVERPASAVKELVENAIDAKSTKIIVNIEEFGTKLIEAIDNGTGMDNEDATNAFVQHATSKILTSEDLIRIRSFGFRGEALASISQAAEETLIHTQQLGNSHGVISKFKSGETNISEIYVKEQGTTIQVHNLFRNLPARLKFLKSAQTENKYIEQTFREIALVHLDIEFELNIDGKLAYRLPITQDRIERIYDIWGKDIASTFYPEEYYDGSNSTAKLLIGKPELAKKSNPLQLIYVNDRPINNKTIHAAIIQGFEGSIHRELKPNYIFMLNVDPETVDVNIHPRKMEVKFENDQEIFRLAYSFTKKVLDKNAKKVLFETAQKEIITEPSFTFPNNTFKEMGEKPQRTANTSSKDEAINFTKLLTNSVRDIATDFPQKQPTEENFRTFQIFNTYIAFEKENQLLIIDQHAAAEKILFEKLANEYTNSKTRSKPLLVPEIIELNKADKQKVLDNLELMKRMGIIIDDFGGNSLRISEIPELLKDFDLDNYISAIIEQEEDLIPLKNFNNDFDLTEEEYYLIATAACHGSIRAGQKLSEPEMINLLRNIDLINKTQNCPHGRPIINTFSRTDIEKGFKRII